MSKVNIIKKGNIDIDRDKFIEQLKNEREIFKLNHKWDDLQSLAFDNAMNRMINGYQSGDYTYNTSEKELRTDDRNGVLTNQNNPGEFDATGYALQLVDNIMAGMPEYKKPKSEYNPKKIATYINRLLFNNRDDWDEHFTDLDAFDEATGKRAFTNRYNAFASALEKAQEAARNDEDEDEENRNKYVASIGNLIDFFKSNGEINDLSKLLFSNNGIDLDLYFFSGKDRNAEPVAPDTRSAEDKELEELEKQNLTLQKRKRNDTYKRYLDYSNLADNNLSVDLSRDVVSTPKLPSWCKKKWNEIGAYKDWESNAYNQLAGKIAQGDLFNKGEDWWNSKGQLRNFGISHNFFSLNKNTNERIHVINPNWTNRLMFQYLLDNVYVPNHNSDSDKGPMPIFDNNKHIVGTKDGYAFVYDPNSRKFYSQTMASIKNGQNQSLLDLDPLFAALQQAATPSAKEGGVLKAQFGSSMQTSVSMEGINDKYEQIRKQQAEDRLDAEVKKSGKSKEQYLAGKRKPSETGFTTTDYVRLGAIGADIASMVASFVPGAGTAASAGLGIGSTLANAYADISDDSVSAGDVLKNLGIGLATSAVGVIPGFGTATKTARILNSARKYVPMVISAAGSAGVVLDPEVRNSFKKIMSTDKLEVDDWKNIAKGFTAIAGLTRTGAYHMKRGALKAVATKVDKTPVASLKTKNGEIKIGEKGLTKEKFDSMQGKSLKEQNEILKSINGQENNELETTRFSLTPWKAKAARGTFNVPKGQYEYDLSAQDNGRFGSLSNKWSDISIINRDLNPSINFNLGLNPFSRLTRKQPSVAPTTATPPTIAAPPIVNPAQPRVPLAKAPVVDVSWKNFTRNPRFLDLRSNDPTASMMRNVRLSGWKQRNYNLDSARDYLTKMGMLKAPMNLLNGIAINGNQIAFWKEGGSVPFKLVPKGQDGLVAPNWYDSRYKLKALGNWNKTLNSSNRTNSGIEGFRGDASNLNSAYEANQSYTKNHDNVTSDILSYYNGTTGLDAQSFVNAYNADAEKIRGFWNGDNVNYQDDAKTGTKATDATAHNLLFRKMFTSRSMPKGEITGANLGYDAGRMEKIAGSSTWHRRMDLYENEFDPNNIDESRIHTIKGADGKEFKVYKKANGDIGLLDENGKPVTDPNNPTTDPNTNNELPGVKPSYVVAARDENTGNGGNQDETPTRNDSVLKTIALARLFGTLNSNGSIYKTLSKSIRPYLKNTYELRSPIHGDFGLLSFYNKQAADLRNLGNKTVTSDSDKQFSQQMETLLKSFDLERQGKLADNQMKEQTAKESLARVEDNVKRRSDLANENLGSIYDYWNKQGQLLADKKLKDWNAIGNFLLQNEYQEQNKLDDWRSWYSGYKQDYAKDKFTNNVQPYLDAFKRAERLHANDTNWDYTTSPEYRTYLAANKKYGIEYKNDLNDILNKLFGYKYQPYKINPKNYTYNYYE